MDQRQATETKTAYTSWFIDPSDVLYPTWQMMFFVTRYLEFRTSFNMVNMTIYMTAGMRRGNVLQFMVTSHGQCYDVTTFCVVGCAGDKPYTEDLRYNDTNCPQDSAVKTNLPL